MDVVKSLKKAGKSAKNKTTKVISAIMKDVQAVDVLKKAVKVSKKIDKSVLKAVKNPATKKLLALALENPEILKLLINSLAKKVKFTGTGFLSVPVLESLNF